MANRKMWLRTRSGLLVDIFRNEVYRIYPRCIPECFSENDIYHFGVRISLEEYASVLKFSLQRVREYCDRTGSDYSYYGEVL